jgi:hypothetical protein
MSRETSPYQTIDYRSYIEVIEVMPTLLQHATTKMSIAFLDAFLHRAAAKSTTPTEPAITNGGGHSEDTKSPNHEVSECPKHVSVLRKGHPLLNF